MDPTPSEIDEFDERDASWDDWEEEDDVAVCPVSSFTGPPMAMLDHWKTNHGFDFLAVKARIGLDFYSCIRLINYIRTKAQSTPNFSLASVNSVEKSDAWVTDDALLKPVVENDPMLYCLDFDDLEGPVESAEPDISALNLNPTQLLEKKVEFMERKYAELQKAFDDYRSLVKEKFLLDELDPTADEDPEEWHMDYYFGSYAENEIHETMLKDAVRTETYRDAMYLNKSHFKDKVVLDIGCGTGILSMFAARAGAKQVFAVDNSTIITKARKIVKENNLEDKIMFFQGEIEKIKLPVDTVDIIVSEWMGYFLLYEGMFDSVIVARDRWLSPDGVMLPNTASMHVAAMDDSEYINEKYNFWNDVYGFRMNTMKEGLFADAQVDVLDPKTIISDACIIKNLDLDTISSGELDFTAAVAITINRTSRLTALCGWFDVHFDFDESERVMFSTSPEATPTHWKQTAFVLKEGIDVVEGTLAFIMDF
ncbi:Protein arginine N-methyltransferase 3 [Irineochytrium annulatum]|nr:Protein arginine N-methyltransferase 3 [Irineochytrium annulatum]